MIIMNLYKALFSNPVEVIALYRRLVTKATYTYISRNGTLNIVLYHKKIANSNCTVPDMTGHAVGLASVCFSVFLMWMAMQLDWCQCAFFCVPDVTGHAVGLVSVCIFLCSWCDWPCSWTNVCVHFSVFQKLALLSRPVPSRITSTCMTHRASLSRKGISSL